MKKILKTLVLTLAVGTFFASCNKDTDNSWYEEQELLRKKEIARIDSTLKAQAPLLKTYAEENFTNPTLDDSTGFWFEILTPATDQSYQYTLTSSGNWVTPIASVKYKGELMNGTVFDEPSQPISMNIVQSSQSQNGLIPAWVIAFRPKKITFNGTEFNTGLIEGGLKKGHKIRFIAPSPYCYDNISRDKIPANSPLVFTIEVLDIK